LKNHDEENIILFDGLCGLCSGLPAFIAKHDRALRFRYSWCQSEEGRSIATRYGISSQSPETLIYVERGTPFFKSLACVKIARGLDFPWRLLWIGVLIPRPIRDRIYDMISRHRYELFGRTNTCPVPPTHLQDRFI
jgi:predicted DCC family thiol-disulfide oxidoreductase YuxK